MVITRIRYHTGLLCMLCILVNVATHAATPPAHEKELHTQKGGVISDPLWELDVPRQDVEPVIMTFVQAYEGGDIVRFMRLFSANVKTEAGTRAARDLREQYQEIFLGTSERHLIIRNARWAHVDANIILEADLMTNMISKRDDLRHQRTGALRIYLARENAIWVISELYFAYDN